MKIILWPIGALFVLVFTLGTTFLSTQFVFGEHHAFRPIPAFLTCYCIGWLGFLAGSFMAVKHPSSHHNLTAVIVLIGLIARFALIPSNLVQENDCYRYVLDGEAVLHHVNPYTYTPECVRSQVPELFAVELERDDAQIILDRISYQDVSTIYPPLAQLCFALGAWLTPWDWLGQRLVFVAIDILTILLIWRLLHRLKLPGSWLVLYAWNPLIIKEIANSAHLDSLIGCCLILSILFLLTWTESQKRHWVCLAGVAFAAAVLAKLYPFFLLPLYLVYLYRAGPGLRTPLLFFVSMILTLCIGYSPFMDAGWCQLTAGLMTYSKEWVRNEGVFGLVDTLFQYPRVLCSVSVLSVVAYACFRLYRSSRSVMNLLGALQVSLLAWFLLIPTSFPWYAVGLIAITACRPRMSVILLSGCWGLYYLLFFLEYNHFPELWISGIKAIEHGLIWLAILIETVDTRRRV